jgi:O-antigen/teichoic acid export membrane protein
MSVVIPPQGGAADAESVSPLVVPTWLDRGKRWAGIFAAYFSTQTITQLAGIVAGLLLINFMPVQEYALYTLAMSVVAFLAFLTDLGATSSLFYFSRKSNQTGEPFEPFVAALLSLRRAAFVVGAVVVLVAFPLVATGKGFDWVPALLATVAIVLAVAFQIAGSVRVLVLRLADRYGPSYRAELTAGVARLGIVAVMIAASLLLAWVAVLGNALAAGALALVAGSALATPTVTIGLASYRRQIVRYLLPTLPSALYFSIQGPLVVWLAAVFGGTRNLAEIGALGRLGLIVGLFSGLSGVVFLPRLSTITDDRLYARRYMQYGALLLVVTAGLFMGAWAAPRIFLTLLGAGYAGLDRELALVILGACFGLLGGYLVSVNVARAWNRWQWAAMVLQLAVQCVMVGALPLSSTLGVVTFGAATALVGMLSQMIIATLGFVRPQWVVASTAR